MVLVVGLGNPGKEYSLSKHNIGFMVVDELAARLGVSIGKKGFKSLYTEALKEEKKLILLKPQTYMNRSGEAVRDATAFFKIPAGDIIVIYDEMDLPLGNIKIKVGGGSAGHKGIESIIVNLGDLDFIRVRVGIGKPVQKSKGASHVLSGFRDEERETIKDVLTKADDAVLEILTSGVESAMNKFNRKEDLNPANQASP
ncbi:MAG TPA: aminoacyl-tRNA hydrolase [Thermodesulfobacteriota bacterium]|nr:aminoacyl-tRNA hydrolase [Thermodesulfobacteriota bacterium]